MIGPARASAVSLTAALALCAVGCDRSPQAVPVVISLSAATPSLTQASVIVDYSRAAARLDLSHGNPSCAALPPDVSAEFEDSGSGRLTILANSNAGFSGPLDLAVCKMIPDDPRSAPSAIAARLRVSVMGRDGDDAGRPAVAEHAGDAPAADVAAAADTNTNATADRNTAVAASASPPDVTNQSAAPDLSGAMRERLTSTVGRDEQRLEEREREGMAARAAAAAEAADGGLDIPVEGLPQSLDDPLPLEDAPAADELEEDEENDPDVRRNTPAYDCYIDVINDAGPIGAMRFNVLHTGATGGWEGNKARVACRWNVGAERSVCTDTGAGRLRCVVLDEAGFATPTPLVTCTFRSEAPLAAFQFDVEVVDAFEPGGRQVVVDMAVTSVVER